MSRIYTYNNSSTGRRYGGRYGLCDARRDMKGRAVYQALARAGGRLCARLKFACAMPAILMALALCIPSISNAQAEEGTYKLNAGDVVALQVWNEPTLSAEQLLVRPDGFISVPVVGEIKAGGNTVSELQRAVVAGLNRYLKDEPTVVVGILSTAGSKVSVLGKVQRPGVFQLTGPTDVTQALALAGGLNSFAAENKIKVLRRDATGTQRAIRFKYSDVKGGDKLDSNILLRSGDVVLVP